MLENSPMDILTVIKPYFLEKEQTTFGLHFYLANQVKETFSYDFIDLGVEIEDIFSSFNIALERIHFS